MQIKETQNTSSQSCFTANKGSRCRQHREMLLKHNFGIKHFNFGLVIFAVLHYRKLKLCRGPLFSNAVKIMLFIFDVQYYVPIKLYKTTGSIQLCEIKMKLYLGYNRDRLEGGQHDF